MSILRAIVAGERDPLKLAQLRDRRCKKSEQEISEHLKGTWMPEHLFNLQMHLEHYAYLQQMVEVYDSTALGAYYRRMAQRKGMSISIGATARKLSEHIYRALKYGQEYVDQGAEAYEARFQKNRLKYAQKVAKSMGYALVPMESPNQVSA